MQAIGLATHQLRATTTGEQGKYGFPALLPANMKSTSKLQASSGSLAPRPFRQARITAGESAVLAVAPDDKVCASDAWPGRELICGTLRVVAPQDGTMTIEAVPGQSRLAAPTLEV